MRFKKIILFFTVTLPLSIALRLVQLSYTVDMTTGFFKNEYKPYGIYILIAIFVFTAVTAVFAFTSHRSPEQPPKINPVLSVASFLLCFSLLYELAAESFPESVPYWQTSLLKLSGFASAVFFAVLALKAFFKLPLPDICTVIPTVYLILRIICYFTAISSLALISDNILLVAAYCTSLLFMLSLAKLYNRSEGDGNFRKLMASGLTSTVLCFTQSVPHIIINISNGFSYNHTSMAANVTVLCLGLFSAVFTFSHFSEKNSCGSPKQPSYAPY